MSKMKILIIGDSYAEYDHEGTWPDYLRKKLNAEVVCKGIGGGSNYTMLKTFIDNFDETFDVVIPVLTNYHRIPNVNNYPFLCAFSNLHPRFETITDMPPGFKESLPKYFKYFHDNEYLIWLTLSILRHIMENVLPSQKIIWLDAILHIDQLCFEPFIINGILTKGCLTNISLGIEIEQTLNVDPLKFMKEIDGDPRPNHLSKENQKVLAKFLVNIINKSMNNIPLSEKELDLNKCRWCTDADKIYAEFAEKLRK